MNQRELLIISITIFLTIAAWVAFDVTRVKNKISIETSTQKIQPLNAVLDPSILNTLQKKDQ
jgi:hypothetical protein